jgi:hypothetical protein
VRSLGGSCAGPEVHYLKVGPAGFIMGGRVGEFHLCTCARTIYLQHPCISGVCKQNGVLFSAFSDLNLHSPLDPPHVATVDLLSVATVDLLSVATVDLFSRALALVDLWGLITSEVGVVTLSYDLSCN